LTDLIVVHFLLLGLFYFFDLMIVWKKKHLCTLRAKHLFCYFCRWINCWRKI